jgi:hypothetical protein
MILWVWPESFDRTRPDPTAVNGIIHVPAHNTPMKPSRREALASWNDDRAQLFNSEDLCQKELVATRWIKSSAVRTPPPT